MSTSHTSSHAHHHITPLKVYLGIGATLLVMTAVTVAVAAIDFGPANILIAMLIAGFKASLVAFFFMHLWYDNKLYFLIFFSSLAFLAVFIGLTMFDTERRAELDRIKDGPIEPKAIMMSAFFLAASAISSFGTRRRPSCDSESTVNITKPIFFSR